MIAASLVVVHPLLFGVLQSDMLFGLKPGGPMRVHERIETNPEVMFGKPVIRGTRITVEQILRELGEGVAPGDVVAAHPRLTPDDVHAAQAFAADYLAGEDTVLGT